MTPTAILPNIYVLGFRTGQYFSSLLKEESNLPSLQQIVSAVASFPVWYKEWWLKLLRDDPVHVLVETTLIAAIVFFLVSRRSKDWREHQNQRLTEKEEAEMVQEWKEFGRKPLAPPPTLTRIQENVPSNGNHDENAFSNIVVHKSNGRTMEIENEKNVRQEVLNFATFDFLGMQANSLPNETALHPVKQASLDALDRYGCGSCGPRGFYGTIDVHLGLEKNIAKFCGTDDAILYSDGASTVTSTIAAFCKRGDLLVVDDGVYEPIRTGVQLSRANVKFFKHNDMEDLKRVLTQVAQSDRSLGRELNAQRRFLVVEALYKNTGNVCPLDKLIELKHEFKYRLILDESFSFGSLGETGRGATELFKKKLMYDAEIVVVSVENSLGSIGALTIGTEEVVDHQRLSGSGYCFSAASPPFTASAAIAALNLLETRSDVTLKRLNANREYLYKNLKTLLHEKLEDLLLITSDERSPIVLLQVADIPETEYLDEVVFLEEVARESLARGVAFVATGAATDLPPGIRLTVSAAQTTDDIDKALTVLCEAVDVVMSRFHNEEDS